MLKVATLLLIALTAGTANADMLGSADHPEIPRVKDSKIHGYSSTEYDAGTFLVKDAQGEIVIRQPEGARTRILYLAKPGATPLMVLRNYEVAFANLGAVAEKYRCPDKCSKYKLSKTLWSGGAILPTDGIKSPAYLISSGHQFDSPNYRYLEIITDKSKYHVGLFVATLAHNNQNKALRGRTVILLEILEIKDFKATLEFVDASTMQAEISQTGHIALYGIQFDHNEATITPESQSTLDEIGKALASDLDLQLYVVGHTDDVGPLDYNHDLSMLRAKAVVAALETLGHRTERLVPIGAGPAAPIASNEDDEGRALNRRVELVKQLNK